MVADQSLARRMERAEALAGARFIEARGRLFPDSGATWTEIGGTYVLFDGDRSPVTQTFGLGLFQEVTQADMERIEAFYRNRRAPVFHEVSPLADKSVIGLLGDRGYRPVDFSSMMYLPLKDRFTGRASRVEGVSVRIATATEHELCARIGVEGWRGLIDFHDLMPDLLRVVTACADAILFLAETGGQPVAMGVLRVREGVALLGGACTIPSARRQGAQRALLDYRLRHGFEAGCDLAMMCAEEPGGGSQRNAEREGFRIAYTRVKWGLPEARPSP
jgi:hypothetical protein